MIQKNVKGILFENRLDASRQLIDILPTYDMRHEDWLIIALSKGAFVIASDLAKKYKLNVDLLINEAITAPANADCEIARVSETEEIVIHERLCDAFEIQNDYIFGEAKRQYEDHILPKIYRYRKDSAFCSLKGRHVLLLDEGCETGLKMLVGVKSAIERGAKSIFVAAPVMPTNIVKEIQQIVDDVYTIHAVDDYLLTASYYDQFDKLTEEDMVKMFQTNQINQTINKE